MTARRFRPLLLVLLVTVMNYSKSEAQCTVCSNAFVNASAPNDIEYDNLVSTFHSSLARLSDGTVMSWGQYTQADGDSHNLAPAAINSDNYPGLTGDILKFTAGSSATTNAQFIVLTTDGLFAWGKRGTVLATALTSDNTFQQVPLGLPSGVAPADVKMLFGTHQTLTITTCSGDVYVLSQKAAMRGNGSSGNNASWYRVTEAGTGFPNLSNVVAVRGSASALMALKNDGTIWTWGPDTYLGNGTARVSSPRATQMTLPAGVTAKMIGATTQSSGSRTSYYILGTDGYVYSLGNNANRVLGDFTTTERLEWVRAKSGTGENDFLSNIVWVSPMEHDGFNYGAVNAITENHDLWAWGNNQSGMLGGGTPASINPTINPGGLTSADKIIAVETGGHTSMTLKECSSRYGYVGHRINGSMGDGSAADAQEPNYNFEDTPPLPVCGANTGAPALFPPDGEVKVNEAKQLTYSPAGGFFEIVSGDATITQDGVLTVNNNVEDIVIRYSTAGNCGPQSTEMTIAGEDIALPVIFADLAAIIQNGQLRVYFTTLTEQQNDHFEIEASKDGKTFVSIGTVKSKATDGTASSPLNYEFILDETAIMSMSSLLLVGLGLLMAGRKKRLALWIAGVLIGCGIFTQVSCTRHENSSLDGQTNLFIRIKQVDIDGGYNYSKIIKVIRE